MALAMRSSLWLCLLVIACGTPPPGGSGGGASGGAGADNGGGGGGAAGGSAAGAAGAGAGGTGAGGAAGGGSASGGGSAGGGSSAGGGTAAVTTIRVHYPTDRAPLSIRGSGAPLNWNSGRPMTAGSGVWTFEIQNLSAEVEFKPLSGDTAWSKGPNYRVQPGQAVDIFPRFFTDAGKYERRWPAFQSAVLGNTRGIWVYLPPTALENPTARFPVLYMHDGQNLFDPAAAFGGNTWRVAEALNAGAADGTLAELVVVGPENTAQRMSEYTPVADPNYGGGRADVYLRMLVEELKPLVERELPVLTGPAHTGICGSSLGGLVSAYAGVKRADVFGRVGAMSPSTWWSNRALLSIVPTTPTSPRPLKVYVDSGDSGAAQDDRVNTAQLAQAYRALGYTDGATLLYVVQAGASHNETFWAQRLPGALRFLFGPRQF